MKLIEDDVEEPPGGWAPDPPGEVRRHMIGQRLSVAFATAGELRQWTVTRGRGEIECGRSCPATRRR